MDLHHPHDKFFRSYFSRPEVLGNFLQTYLPPGVVQVVDWDSLQVDSGTYIDEDHKEHFSDLSATVDIQGKSGRVYILVEHKSYNDKWALLQILRYMVQTWDRDVKNHPKEALRPIIPLLFYHGKPVKIKENLADLFDTDIPEALKAYQPHFVSEIFNLTGLPDSKIQGSAEVEAALWAMKHNHTQVELALRAFDRLASTLGRVFVEQPGFREIELYLLSTTDLTMEQILDKINKELQNSFLREDIMSTAEQLILKGRQEGILETAKTMKNYGMSVEQICQITGLSEEVVKAL